MITFKLIYLFIFLRSNGNIPIKVVESFREQFNVGFDEASNAVNFVGKFLPAVISGLRGTTDPRNNEIATR